MIVVAASGCDQLFQLDPIAPRRDGAVAADGIPTDTANEGDSGGGADASLFCAMPLLFDNFTGGEPCQPWAPSHYMDFGATISETGGALVITPSTQVNSVAGCYSAAGTIDFGLGGVIAQVSEVAQGTSVYSVLGVEGINVQILSTGTTLRFQDTSGMDLGAPADFTAAMRWWRIRPLDTTTVAGEYSTDRMNWTMLGTRIMAIPQRVAIHLSAGTNTTTVTGSAKFESLESCP